MTKEQEIALTASHLSAGMIGYTLYGAGKKDGIEYAGPESPNSTLLDIWGQGCLELHQALSQYAVNICELLDKLEHLQDFPGVLHYEVTEEFGEWFAEMIVENGGTAPMDRCCLEKIALLTAQFFSQSPEVEDRQAVFEALAPLGWAELAKLRESITQVVTEAPKAPSPWAVDTVEPKFAAGQEVFYKNGTAVRKVRITKVLITHYLSSTGEQAARSNRETYHLEGVGEAGTGSLFLTAEEAFAAK